MPTMEIFDKKGLSNIPPFLKTLSIQRNCQINP